MEKKITKIPQHFSILSPYKRVGIYCRVSTVNRDQLDSLSSQVSSLTQYVFSRASLNLADMYIDIGSGISVAARDQFQRMILDCEQRKLDVVLTKSISRFGRNTVEILQTLQKLTTLGVEVIFDKENISSSDANNSLIISLLESVAQEENQSNSLNTKWSIVKRVRNGSSKLYMRKCYGYIHNEDGELIIEQQEAKVVQFIFKLYLQGASIAGIRKRLERISIPSPTGNQTWCNGTIDKILSNEKYVGDVIIFKTITANYPNRKRIKNNGVEDRFLSASQHPAIISRKMFDEVQAEKQRRCNYIQDESGKHRSAYKYSSKGIDIMNCDL